MEKRSALIITARQVEWLNIILGSVETEKTISVGNPYDYKTMETACEWIAKHARKSADTSIKLTAIVNAVETVRADIYYQAESNDFAAYIWRNGNSCYQVYAKTAAKIAKTAYENVMECNRIDYVENPAFQAA